jgi:hypothetical protein
MVIVHPLQCGDHIMGVRDSTMDLVLDSITVDIIVGNRFQTKGEKERLVLD